METKINTVVGLICVLCLPVFITGCADNTSYYQSVKEQNLMLQMQAQRHEKEREYERQKHERTMLQLSADVLLAAAKSSDESDDILAPLIIMVLEDKWSTTAALTKTDSSLQLQAIEAPDSIGDTIQKSSGALLGLGGLALGIMQSHNMADVAKAGISAAGVTINGSATGEASNSVNTTITTDTTTVGDEGVINPEVEVEETEYEYESESETTAY